jgi:uncharacterized protein Usg
MSTLTPRNEKRNHTKTEDQLLKNSLVTLQIFYWLPDYPSILQQYIWQEFDLEPEFPRVTKFLEFWKETLEGKIRYVRLNSTRLIQPSEFRFAEGGKVFRLN